MTKVERPRPLHSLPELVELSATASTTRKRRYWHVIFLMRLGNATPNGEMSVTRVAELTGFSRSWVRELVKRYNVHGAEAFEAHKPHTVSNPKGRRPLLSPERQNELAEILDGYMAPDGKPWTVKTFKVLMEEKLRRRVDGSTAWRYFRKLAPKRLQTKRIRVLTRRGACIPEAEYWEKHLPVYLEFGPKKRGRKKRRVE